MPPPHPRQARRAARVARPSLSSASDNGRPPLAMRVIVADGTVKAATQSGTAGRPSGCHSACSTQRRGRACLARLEHRCQLAPAPACGRGCCPTRCRCCHCYYLPALHTRRFSSTCGGRNASDACWRGGVPFRRHLRGQCCTPPLDAAPWEPATACALAAPPRHAGHLRRGVNACCYRRPQAPLWLHMPNAGDRQAASAASGCRHWRPACCATAPPKASASKRRGRAPSRRHPAVQHRPAPGNGAACRAARMEMQVKTAPLARDRRGANDNGHFARRHASPSPKTEARVGCPSSPWPGRRRGAGGMPCYAIARHWQGLL